MKLYYFKNETTGELIGIDSQSGGYPYLINPKTLKSIPFFETDISRANLMLNDYIRMGLFNPDI
jgi:hypothetical protein